MDSNQFSILFSNSSKQHDELLIQLFTRLDVIDNSFYAIILEEGGKYKFGYTCASIERLTGYPIREYSYHGGWSFFYSITPPEHRLLILEQEAYYFKKARQSSFDALKPFIIEIEAAIQHKNNRVINARLISIILEFTMSRVPCKAINVWLLLDDLTEDKVLNTRLEIESILRTIHKVYVQVHEAKLSQVKSNWNDGIPLSLSYPLYDCDEITKREYLVLKLIADGLSSQKIADKLCISFHTAETHRRHLLQKFKAQNVAELIKKATKLFWLE